MKTKFVYVVVSDETSLYLEQAVVSAYSVRLYNPGAYIEVVIDTNTAETLNGKRHFVYNYFDKVTVIETPSDYSKKQKSRFLKTNLRNLISGDYLFIDTDTIICDSLEDIDQLQNDICAVREYNRISNFTTKDRWMNLLAEKANLVSVINNEPYFNSGVLYVKDTSRAHSLYDRWYDCWLKTKASGVETDQTALCWANKLEGHVIDHIDDLWNCQIKTRGRKFLPEARIIHYFWELGEGDYPLSRHSIYNTIKEYGEIPPVVKDLVNSPKLLFVNQDEILLIGKANRLKSQFGTFYKVIEWMCNVYVYMRLNWFHRNIIKELLS